VKVHSMNKHNMTLSVQSFVTWQKKKN
jgi:hypothetical protein